MSIGILGRKVGMSRLFGENGEDNSVTVIEAGPCHVIQVKTKEKDGYNAIQVGFAEKKENRTNKPDSGHFKKAGVSPFKMLKEFRLDKGDVSGFENKEFESGEQVTVEIFSVGERVDVSGTSKGKGFTGVMKRWGFKGHKATHGAENHRTPGSIGASADPSRVFKGLPMAGRMGGEKVTVQNLEVLKVDPERNLLVVKGSVPGPNKGFLMIKKAAKIN
ncbi:50S ribosomal protein L3 [Candidatus Poribacteria bacterium]|nr:50S ribosomal protein L3 [Candidatus Poribacteria bacterium]